MNKVLKYVQWGLIALTIVPLIALIIHADVFTRVLTGISAGSAAFYYIIDLIRKGRITEE